MRGEVLLKFDVASMTSRNQSTIQKDDRVEDWNQEQMCQLKTPAFNIQKSPDCFT